MVVKFYISMTSGNKEIKKVQMKAQLIMESKGVDFRVIDICDPNQEEERRFMQKNAKPKPGARNAIPPQFFNDEEYCGDYDGFDEANETDCLEEFLKLPRGTLPQVPIIHHNLSNFSSREVSMEKEVVSTLMNGISSHRETPEKTETVPETNKDDEAEEEEEESEYEEDDEEPAQSTFQGEPSDSLVVEKTSINEDAVAEQQQSNVESQKQQNESENSDEEEEEEDDEEVEQPKVEAADSVQEQQTPSERVETSDEKPEKQVVEEPEEEEEEEEESEEEEDEEDEANKNIISALPDEDDLMEMSTTVATAERFTEFSYKQLPGEA